MKGTGINMNFHVKKAARSGKIIRTGSSLPAVIDTVEGERIFVKFSGAGDGALSSITEWICSHLGTLSGMPVLYPSLVIIEENLALTIQDEEMRDLIKASCGLNICFPFIENASVCGNNDIRMMDSNIYFYDCFLLNPDRHEKNTNCIHAAERFYSLDYGVSFLIRGIIEERNYDINHQILSQLTRNPLRIKNGNSTSFSDRMSRICKCDIDAVIDEIPECWFTMLQKPCEKTKELLKKGIISACGDINRLNTILNYLDGMKDFDEKENRKRQQKERELFVRNLYD